MQSITLRPIILLTGVLGMAFAGKPVLTREGKYWVQVARVPKR